MTANQLIEQIRALPPAEQEMVRDFIQQLEKTGRLPARSAESKAVAEQRAAVDSLSSRYRNALRELAK